MSRMNKHDQSQEELNKRKHDPLFPSQRHSSVHQGFSAMKHSQYSAVLCFRLMQLLLLQVRHLGSYYELYRSINVKPESA